jgi:hypothetical protein
MRTPSPSRSACLGVLLLIEFLAPAALGAQGRDVNSGAHEQMRASAGLTPADTPPAPGRREVEGVRGSSDYNWGAAWLGMGIGAIVGAGLGYVVIGPSDGEAPPEAYAIGGALIFGIVGWFVGYAVGNP